MNRLRVALLAALGAPAVLAAQAGGPYAPLILTLPTGARTLAMGNTGVVSRDDDVLFFNPAQLIVARGTSGSAERYSANSGGGTLSSVTRLTSSAIALGVKLVDYDARVYSYTPVAYFPVDRSTSVDQSAAPGTSLEASLGYANTIKGIRVGAAAKYVEDQIPGIRVGRGAFDLGIAKDLFRYYTVGLSVQNIGKSMAVPCDNAPMPAKGDCTIPPTLPGVVPPPQWTTAYLPLRTTIGASFSHQLGEFDFIGTGAVAVLRKDYVTPSGGAELGYSWIDGYNIALRAGARRALPGEEPFTAGVGFTADRLSIDYALETLSGSRIGHRVGFRIR